jgi:hypothetical protein
VAPDALRRAFLHEAVRLHPDTSPEPDAAERFRDIQSARQTLEDPVENLRVYLETVYAAQSPCASSPADLPADLLALFSRVTPFRQTLETLRTRIETARSPLAKALAERAWNDALVRWEPVAHELEAAWIQRETSIQTWWNSPPPRDSAQLWQILRDFKFLQKWRSQLPRPLSSANPANP